MKVARNVPFLKLPNRFVRDGFVSRKAARMDRLRPRHVHQLQRREPVQDVVNPVEFKIEEELYTVTAGDSRHR